MHASLAAAGKIGRTAQARDADMDGHEARRLTRRLDQRLGSGSLLAGGLALMVEADVVLPRLGAERGGPEDHELDPADAIRVADPRTPEKLVAEEKAEAKKSA